MKSGRVGIELAWTTLAMALTLIAAAKWPEFQGGRPCPK